MTRWRTYAVSLDGRPWTAVSDHRVTIFTRGEAPSSATLMMPLAPHLAMALACGEPVSRTSLVDLAVDGRCRWCTGARELIAADGFRPCHCNDDPVRVRLSVSGRSRGVFDLRLIAAALSRMPPGDLLIGSPDADYLAIRNETTVALVLGMRAAKEDLASVRAMAVGS